jgi:hypothetical protein
MYAFYLNVKHVTKSLPSVYGFESTRYWSPSCSPSQSLQELSCSGSSLYMSGESTLCVTFQWCSAHQKDNFAHRFIKSSSVKALSACSTCCVRLISPLVKLFDLISSWVLSPKNLVLINPQHIFLWWRCGEHSWGGDFNITLNLLEILHTHFICTE